METALAKRFIYYQTNFGDKDKLYISRNLEKIMEIDEDSKDLIGVYGVIETESGPKMMHVEFAYDGHPILLGEYLHEEFFMKHYESKPKIILD